MNDETTNPANATAPGQPGSEYAAAYAAQYSERDLQRALKLYARLLAEHPGAKEATYSRAQVKNIVSSVIPEKELLDAQIELALQHFEHGAPEESAEGSKAALLEDKPA